MMDYRKYKEYRVKMSLFTHVEGDPELKCKNYDEENTYSNCLRKFHIDRITGLIRCVPPWLGCDKAMWCNSTFPFLKGNLCSKRIICISIHSEQ